MLLAPLSQLAVPFYMFGAVAARRNSEQTLNAAGVKGRRRFCSTYRASGADNPGVVKSTAMLETESVLAIVLNLRNSQQINSWNIGEVD
jgi:hypothetical protein